MAGDPTVTAIVTIYSHSHVVARSRLSPALAPGASVATTPYLRSVQVSNLCLSGWFFRQADPVKWEIASGGKSPPSQRHPRRGGQKRKFEINRSRKISCRTFLHRPPENPNIKARPHAVFTVD